MNTQLGFNNFLSFINSQLKPADNSWRPSVEEEPRRAITISRQSGSGGHLVAEKLLKYLQAQMPDASPPWTVFDRNLVEKAIEEHRLPKRLAKFMAEDRISAISDTMDELFGLHPPSWMLVRKVSDTILRLAELGNVILIGRGAHIITRNLPYIFHVRLVGSIEHRAAHMQELNGLTSKQALQFVRKEERARERYLRKYFKVDIQDPLQYHMVINTDVIPYETAAHLIGDLVLQGVHMPVLAPMA